MKIYLLFRISDINLSWNYCRPLILISECYNIYWTLFVGRLISQGSPKAISQKESLPEYIVLCSTRIFFYVMNTPVLSMDLLGNDIFALGSWNCHRSFCLCVHLDLFVYFAIHVVYVVYIHVLCVFAYALQVVLHIRSPFMS